MEATATTEAIDQEEVDLGVELQMILAKPSIAISRERTTSKYIAIMATVLCSSRSTLRILASKEVLEK